MGSFRLLRVLAESLKYLKQFGLSETDLEQILMLLSPGIPIL
jgi:hypothetical protein